MTKTKPIVWTISGADCSGGAGIAADIKTAHGLGVELCHFITANTVQNSQSLVSVNPVAVDLLKQQFEALVDDKPPQVIKIGLIANSEQLAWLKQTVKLLKEKLPSLKVVLDPVGQASVGGKFSSYSLQELINFLPLVDLITPNAEEARTLANSTGSCTDDNVELLALAILEYGCNSVLIKGGHITRLDQENNQTCIDYCLHTLTDDDSSKMSQAQTIAYQLSSPRVATSYSHGGGCSFASAMACFIALGHLTRDAFTLTKAFINQGMSANQGKEQGYGAFEQTGLPKQAQIFPTVVDCINQKYNELALFPSLNLAQDEKLGLYPVIDSLYWLKRLLPLNLNIIQLRVKNKSEAELDEIIAEAVALTKGSKTRLFINDYWQLAIKHGAYGVHIGQEDLLEADLQTIQQSGLRLGISTHGCYEFLLTQQLQPSYLAIGAIFPTKTKNMTGQIQGLDNLNHIMGLSTDIPVVAIGGINLERAPQVLATGVDSIAVVTAITEAPSPEGAVDSLQCLINGN